VEVLATTVESTDVLTPIAYEPAMVGLMAVIPMPASTVTPVAFGTLTGEVIVTLLAADCVGSTVTGWVMTELLTE
jgi:hypothetical protein